MFSPLQIGDSALHGNGGDAFAFSADAIWLVPADGSAVPTQLNAPTSTLQEVKRFEVRGNWVAFAGDMRTRNVVELFSVALDGSQPQRRESGPLVFGGDVLADRLALVSDEIVVYMADQHTNGHPELYFSLLQPIPRLGRAPAPSASRTFGD